MTSQRVVSKNLAGEEDLLWGEGQVTQSRSGGSFPITQIRSIYPANSIAERDALDTDKFKKCAVFDGLGGATFYEYIGGAWVTLQPKTLDFSTVSDLLASSELAEGDRVTIESYTATNNSGVMFGKIVAAGTGTHDGGSFIDLPVVGLQLQQNMPSVVSARLFGVEADGTDQLVGINNALAYVRSNKGKLFFPANRNGVSPTVYAHSDSLEFGASDVIIEGESTSVNLSYTGTGTGLLINRLIPDPHRERCSLRNISLFSSTGAVAFDFTSGSYGNYENVEIAYTSIGAKLIRAIGHNGAGPYFNKFDGLSLFGGASRTQIGISLEPDTSGNLADGPNANQFTNIKRGASLARLINIVSGTGNLFTNTSGESISDALIVLNEVNFSDTGTSTSTTTNTLTDTSKVWSTIVGDPLNFVNAAVRLTTGIPGESRRVVSNTSDTLILDRPFSQNPGSAVSYQISKGKAVKNMFVNVRQEGLNTDNPDGIRLMSGARGNELSQIEIGSLGSGVIVDDQSQDQTNKVRQGDLVVQSYTVKDPGASTSIELIPRTSGEGGIRTGSNMSLEYIEMLSPNFVVGSASATLTVDHGGVSTGNGVESQTVIIDDFNSKSSYISCDKIMRSTSNNGIFASLATNANVNAAADFIINLGYRVQ